MPCKSFSIVGVRDLVLSVFAYVIVILNESRSVSPAFNFLYAPWRLGVVSTLSNKSMESTSSGVQGTHKPDDEKGRHAKRLKLKHLNTTPIVQGRLLSDTFS